MARRRRVSEEHERASAEAGRQAYILSSLISYAHRMGFFFPLKFFLSHEK